MNADTATPSELVQFILDNANKPPLEAFARSVNEQMVTRGATPKQVNGLRNIAKAIQQRDGKATAGEDDAFSIY
jgi:hypothetical protein